jgi:hypothetical protein
MYTVCTKRKVATNVLIRKTGVASAKFTTLQLLQLLQPIRNGKIVIVVQKYNCVCCIFLQVLQHTHFTTITTHKKRPNSLSNPFQTCSC